jgi:hypothetical protein
VNAGGRQRMALFDGVSVVSPREFVELYRLTGTQEDV